MKQRLTKQRLAIVLFNLGAPGCLGDVRPFLKNLFNDTAIIALGQPWRTLLAELISRARAPKACKIYEKLGGGSPLLANTVDQKMHLQQAVAKALPDEVTEVFVAMRYWHPFIAQAVGQVKAFQPDRVILLPLYPQYSVTTTGSSFKEWHRQAKKQQLDVPTHEVAGYPQHASFLKAHIDRLWGGIEEAKKYGRPRILFSAHGLPQKIIDQGDPYERQIHETVHGILEGISKSPAEKPEGGLPAAPDSVICYQSRVGPLKWLGPSTEDELRRAGRDKVPVVVVPVAFVSEHSETLVELDIDYKVLAKEEGVPFYGRVPALGTHPAYIEALAQLAAEAKKRGTGAE